MPVNLEGAAHAKSDFKPDAVTLSVDREGKVEQRSADSDLGGTMRLGRYACELAPGSVAARIYGRVWWVLGLTFAILGLGGAMLFRRGDA